MTASPTGSPPVLDALEAAWKRSDGLFGSLRTETLHAQPIPLRHPFVFYLGHLPAFGVNQVLAGVLGEGGLDPDLDQLFERGIDPDSSESAATQRPAAWPALPQILAYRDEARNRLRAAVPRLQARGAADPLAERLRVLHLVLEHELMHHETLLYMLAELDHTAQLTPTGPSTVVTGDGPDMEILAIPAGEITLGADFDALEFGWDNEFPAQTVAVPRFALDRYPVTVSQFREFVDGGGYQDATLWTPEAWSWQHTQGKPHPWRWQQDPEGTWWHRTLQGRVPLDEVGAWPALVTAGEAAAFCTWTDSRLPTEAELHRAAYGGRTHAAPWPWGDTSPGPQHGNFGGRSEDPMPVNHHPAGDSALGVSDLLGNGWEWTSTPFLPRAGFSAWARTYPGYSADFFDGEHRVLFGGSWATDARLLRRSFRNWFRPQYPWVFSAFRRVW